MASKVTLVSAPPGFGKSTLVDDWIAGLPPTEPAGWLSLDSGDNDPSGFWRYVIAAVQAAAPDTGREAAAVLESPEPQVERALRSLLNDLAALGRDIVVVLDDFHVIGRPDIHEAVAYPALGIVGAPVYISFTVGTMLDITGPGTVWQAVGVAPFFIWELAVGLWMTFKGFNRNAPILVASDAKTGTPSHRAAMAAKAGAA